MNASCSITYRRVDADSLALRDDSKSIAGLGSSLNPLEVSGISHHTQMLNVGIGHINCFEYGLHPEPLASVDTFKTTVSRGVIQSIIALMSYRVPSSFPNLRGLY